jgi:hypothetical protein
MGGSILGMHASDGVLYLHTLSPALHIFEAFIVNHVSSDFNIARSSSFICCEDPVNTESKTPCVRAFYTVSAEPICHGSLVPLIEHIRRRDNVFNSLLKYSICHNFSSRFPRATMGVGLLSSIILAACTGISFDEQQCSRNTSPRSSASHTQV